MPHVPPVWIGLVLHSSGPHLGRLALVSYYDMTISRPVRVIAVGVEVWTSSLEAPGS